MTDRLINYLNNYTNLMKEDVPGLISVSVVDIMSGKTYANAVKLGGVDVMELNKLQTNAVKYTLKGLEHLDNLNVKKFEDIIITLEEQVHILMPSDLQSFMSYVILDANKGNIAMAQTLHKKHYTNLFKELVAEFGEEAVRNHPFFQPKSFVTLSTPIVEEKAEVQKKNTFLHDLFFSN